MNIKMKRKLCVCLSAVTALSLCACSAETPESTFDNPMPWHDAAAFGSYEKLDYKVNVYDTSASTDEKERVLIAEGDASFTLNEKPEGTSGYVFVDMSCTFVYNDLAPELDRGKTDEIKSHVEFEMNSLAARTMTKTVKLDDREGQTNRSYKLTADYFGTHSATYSLVDGNNKTEDVQKGEASELALSANVCRDNEMMFYVARAQAVGISSSTNFKMVNIFDSFRNGALTEYRMLVSGGEATHKIDVGDWVKDFGVEATETTEGETTVTAYPVSCYYTSISINDERHGPPYIVMYSEKPFTANGKSHSKIPVQIMYSQYNGTQPYRHTEYVLTDCSFDRAE